MADITQTCRISGKQFVITDAEQEFLKSVSPVFNGVRYDISLPTVSPEERMRRRLAFRNERKLYNHKCDLSGKQIISMYTPDSAYKVYDQEEWWSDKWDAMEYGQDFDFSRPFFEQFKELQLKVPRVCITNTNSENSVYTNYTANNKNCFLVFSNSYGNNESCMYGTCLAKDDHCIDCIHVGSSTYCYDCIDCDNCYRIISSKNCENCQDGYFLEDCKNCSDCIGCKGLRNQQYRIFNKQHTKDAYENLKSKMNLGSRKSYDEIKQKAFELFSKVPSKYADITNSENCTGDHISNSLNCMESFDVKDSRECRYVQYSVNHNKDVQDASYSGGSELSYECLSLVESYQILFSNLTWWNDAYLTYCELVFNSKYCFGCIGLNRKEYCILNKQYTKDEYEKLVPRIIEHMKKTGEWGEFFPSELSPFGYNETVAQEFLPLTKEGAMALNYHWVEDRFSGLYDGPQSHIPDHIEEADEEICKKILTCEVTGKAFKIIPQEFQFYKKLCLPLPTKSFESRHMERVTMRNPRFLWGRSCDNCQAPIQTPYSPRQGGEIVYCEKCYNEFIYN